MANETDDHIKVRCLDQNARESAVQSMYDVKYDPHHLHTVLISSTWMTCLTVVPFLRIGSYIFPNTTVASSARYLDSSILLVLSRRKIRTRFLESAHLGSLSGEHRGHAGHMLPLIDIAHPVCVSFPFDSSIQVEEVCICFNERVSSVSEGVYIVSDIECKGLMLSALDMTACSRVVFIILALLRIMYLPGCVCQNRPVEWHLICDSGSSVRTIPPSFPSRCCCPSCSCPSSIAMGEHILVDIFTMEIPFFGNPYCII